jgi:hypothetical protein
MSGAHYEDRTNKDRAATGKRLVRTYAGAMNAKHEPFDTNATDLIADVLHACADLKIDIDAVIRMARCHLEEELAEESEDWDALVGRDEEPDAEETEEPGTCSVCGGPLGILGGLGNMMHYSCRDCGAESHDSEPKKEEPATEESDGSTAHSVPPGPRHFDYLAWMGQFEQLADSTELLDKTLRNTVANGNERTDPKKEVRDV